MTSGRGPKSRISPEQRKNWVNMVNELVLTYGSQTEVSKLLGLSSNSLNTALRREYTTTNMYNRVLELYQQSYKGAEDAPIAQPQPPATKKQKEVQPYNSSDTRKHARIASKQLEGAVESIMAAADHAEAIAQLGFKHLAEQLTKLNQRFLEPLWK